MHMAIAKMKPSSRMIQGQGAAVGVSGGKSVLPPLHLSPRTSYPDPLAFLRDAGLATVTCVTVPSAVRVDRHLCLAERMNYRICMHA